jgi:hypothetical protein
MSGHDNTPMIDFGARRDDDSCPILICAGQSAATAKTDGARIIEPGRLDFEFGRSAGEIVLTHSAELTGAVRRVDHTRALTADIEVRRG